jgi:hypothetical protein
MNKFLVDSYSGMHGGRAATKSFSAYENAKSPAQKSMLSERDQAIETVRRIREKKREKEEKTTGKSIFEMARKAKERSLEARQTKESSSHEENNRSLLDTPPAQTDDEIKQNLEMMKEMNEKMKTESLGKSPDEILSGVISDLF